LTLRTRGIITSSVDAYPKRFTGQAFRRAFLCGQDPETSKDYDYRRQWIENRILELAQYFAIEVYSYAVMHNHYHLVVYSDPKAPESWTDLEVADKWLKVFPGKFINPKFKTQRDLRVQAIVKNG